MKHYYFWRATMFAMLLSLVVGIVSGVMFSNWLAGILAWVITEFILVGLVVRSVIKENEHD